MSQASLGWGLQVAIGSICASLCAIVGGARGWRAGTSRVERPPCAPASPPANRFEPAPCSPSHGRSCRPSAPRRDRRRRSPRAPVRWRVVARYGWRRVATVPTWSIQLRRCSSSNSYRPRTSRLARMPLLSSCDNVLCTDAGGTAAACPRKPASRSRVTWAKSFAPDATSSSTACCSGVQSANCTSKAMSGDVHHLPAPRVSDFAEVVRQEMRLANLSRTEDREGTSRRIGWKFPSPWKLVEIPCGTPTQIDGGGDRGGAGTAHRLRQRLPRR